MNVSTAANSVDIAGRRIGPGQPCFIIAEAGVNHNGSLELARRLVEAAVEAGADAVKFQTFRTERLVTVGAPLAEYQRRSGPAADQFHLLKGLELSPEAHRELMELCRARRILFLSSPFDFESADFLEELGLPAFKVGSGELTNLPFLGHLAAKGRPLIVSTGMARLGEVEAALRTIEQAGDPPLILLHCTSRYPAEPAEANLRAMATLGQAFGRPVGYSDHTLGLAVPLAAAALGAAVIEKHFTLDRSLAGPDHQASAEPGELADLVRGVRQIEAALGHGRKEPSPAEAETARVARRSLVAAQDLKAGQALTAEAIAVLRPGTGLPPELIQFLLGLRVRRDIPAGTLLSLEMVE